MRTKETYYKAETNRARALAFLHSKPGAVLADVMRHMGMEKERAAQLLLRMARLGEVVRVEGGVSPHRGRPCAKHYPLVAETVTADEIFAHLAGNLRGAPKGRKIKRSTEIRRAVPAPRLFGGL